MCGKIGETVLILSYLQRNSIILMMASVRAQPPICVRIKVKTRAQLYHAYDEVTAKL